MRFMQSVYMYWHSKDGIWFSFIQSRYRARQALVCFGLMVWAAAKTRGLSPLSPALPSVGGKTSEVRTTEIENKQMLLFMIAPFFQPEA